MHPTQLDQPIPSEKEKAQTGSISLTPSLWKLAKSIGVGTASRGIQIALRFYAKHNSVKEDVE